MEIKETDKADIMLRLTDKEEMELQLQGSEEDMCVALVAAMMVNEDLSTALYNAVRIHSRKRNYGNKN